MWINLRLDQRVYEELEDLVDQAAALKFLLTKRKVGGASMSHLDGMITAVNMDIDSISKICAERMAQNCKKCPVILPSNTKNASLFEKVLELFSGRVKCTGTCMNATCQSLDFVLLCTFALKTINSKRMASDSMLDAAAEQSDVASKELEKSVSGKHFNSELDPEVMLFDDAAASMDKRAIEKRVREAASSFTTAPFYNPDDARFFGGLRDKSSTIDESLMREEGT